MPKQPTEKQLAARKALGEAAKARAAAKRAAKEIEAPVADTVVESKTEAPIIPENAVVLTQDQFQQMLDRLESLEQQKTTQPMQPTLGAQGQVVGAITRFSIDPNHYANPVESLYEMPELRRFALKENYDIRWSCSPVKYQSAMGTWFVEPRFELELWKRDFDDNNDEFRRILLGRASFFEDPPANLLEAELAGVQLGDIDENTFADKMRMYRYKFWIAETLNPKRPGSTAPKKVIQVIGGKAYETEAYSTLA